MKIHWSAQDGERHKVEFPIGGGIPPIVCDEETTRCILVNCPVWRTQLSSLRRMVHTSSLCTIVSAILVWRLSFCSSVVELQRAPLLFLFTPQLSQLFPRIRQRDAAMSLLCSSFNLSTLPQFPDLCFCANQLKKTSQDSRISNNIRQPKTLTELRAMSKGGHQDRTYGKWVIC